MEQRDLIKDQIEQLGRVLGKIFADFTGLKSQGRVSQAIEISNEKLQTQLDIDIDKIISLNSEELEEYVVKKELTFEHIEVLSEYLTEIGKVQMEQNRENAKRIFIKAIELLDISDGISQTMCFTRMDKKSNIENLLKSIG